MIAKGSTSNPGSESGAFQFLPQPGKDGGWSRLSLSSLCSRFAERIVKVGRLSLLACLCALMGADVFAGVLPSEYDQLQYLESNGKQYIDTKVVPKADTRAVMRFALTGTPAAQMYCGWGSSANQEAFLFGADSGGFYVNVSPNWKTAFRPATPLDTEWHTWDVGSGTQIFDGVEVGTSSIQSTASNNQTIYLFAGHVEWQGTTPGYSMKVRISDCRIYEGENLVRDFVSVRRVADNSLGLYDLENGVFYPRQGSEDFVAGPKANSISVVGVPETFGSPVPPYGEIEGCSVGTAYEFSAPPAWTNDLGNIAATCTGWTYTTNRAPGVVASGSGANAVISYAGGAAFFTWQWSIEYLVNISKNGEGVVSPSGPVWVRSGETLTVTAAADDGSSFYRYIGDIPDSMLSSSEVGLVVDSPKNLTAVFASDSVSPEVKRWVGVTGESIPAGVAIEMQEVVELEYVASTGAQIVDTGIVPGTTTSVELHYGDVTWASSKAIFGQDWNSNQYLFNMQGSTDYYFHGSGNKLCKVEEGKDYFFRLGTDRVATLGEEGTEGKSYKVSSLAASANKNLAIFGCITDTSRRSKFRLYSFKIWQNGEIVRDFIPALVNGTACLYDKVGKKVYGSTGSEPLAAGPAKEGVEQALWVTGTPFGYGDEAIYGKMAQAAGTTETYSVPAEVIVDEYFKAVCEGWELREFNQTVGRIETISSGNTASVSVTLPDPVVTTYLVWKWKLLVKSKDGSYIDYAAGDGFLWDDPSNWSPYGVPTASDRTEIAKPATVCAPLSAICRSLYIGPDATFYLGGTNDVKSPLLYYPDDSSDRTLDVLGDFVVEGTVALGAHSVTPETRVVVAGDLVVSKAASLNIFAGQVVDSFTDATWIEWKKGGASVTVGRDLVLEDSAQVTTRCHKDTGMTVVWNVASNVVIGAGTRFAGSMYTSDANCYGLGWEGPNGFGFKKATNYTSGGAYGGAGGNNNGNTYGYANAPFYPGSPGTYRTDGRGKGGGAVIIHAGGDIAFNGKIYVTGGHNENMGNGGGSGGSVWFTCRDFTAGSEALIHARGGRTNQHGASYAGGGGRVAIMTGSPNEAQIDQLYQTGECDGMLVVTEDMNDPVLSPWPALVDVRGGDNAELTSNPSHASHGKPGTSVYLQNASGKVIATVGGNKDTTATEPAYGSFAIDTGDFTFRAPTHFYEDSGLSRYPCEGYTWSDAGGNSGSGSGCEFTVNVTSDITVNWIWGTKEHFLDVRDGGYCSVSFSEQGNNELGWYDEGSVVQVVCTPEDEDTAFAAWVGDIPVEVCGNRAVSITVDKPKVVVATLYRDASRARDLTWRGTAGDLDWFNKDNWDGIAIPGKYDTVTVSDKNAGDFQVKYPSAIEIKSFTMTAAVNGFWGARPEVTQHNNNDNYRTGIYYTTAISGEDTRPYSLKVSGDFVADKAAKLYFGGINQANRIDIQIGGDVVFDATAANASTRLQIYGGHVGEMDDVATFVNGGASITVGGNFRLLGYSEYSPAADRYSGAPVILEVAGEVFINTNAVVNGDARGFGRSWNNPGTGWIQTTYGPGRASTTDRFGGNYGGRGGGRTDGEVGYAAAPFYPGSASASSSSGSYVNDILSGGGAVRIDAQKISLYGKIYADGIGRYCVAGGSGGGVWLTARKFEFGPASLIRAAGGQSTGYGGSGGGSGGRIALGVKISVGQISKLYSKGRISGMEVTDLTQIGEDSPLSTLYGGISSNRVSVIGGLGFKQPGATATLTSSARADSGTAVLVKAPPMQSMIILR